MKTPLSSVCALGFILMNHLPASSMAQTYFRDLDTRSFADPDPYLDPYEDPYVDPYEDPYLEGSVYNESIDFPQENISQPVEALPPRFEATSHLDPAMPPTVEEEERYNWAFGPLRFNVAAGLSLEYNDNVNLAPSDLAESDFILRPSVTLDSAWRLSEMNTLRFSLGIGYSKYFSQTQNDTILISPDSALVLTVMVGDVRITVRNRFSYQEDPYDLAVIDNTSTFRRFENQAGIQFDWAVNPDLTLTVGYDHYNLWSFEEDFDNLTRAVDTVYVRPAYQVNPSIRLGLNASASWVRFQERIQNNGASFFLGPFAEAQLTDSTSVYLELGWQLFNFQNDGIIPDSDNASTPYVRAEVINELNEHYVHRLGFSRTAEVGYNTNFYELNHVEYSATWDVTPSLIALPSIFYEYYTTSGAFPERANRYGGALGLRYILTPSVTLGLDYRHLRQDSNIPGADYRQNLVMLSFFYNF